MKQFWKWFWRVLGMVLGIAVLAVLIAILFAGPIAKYFLQKYDTEWIGREMEVDALHIYLLNGGVNASDIVFYEADGKSKFLTADKLKGKVRLWPLISSRVEIDTLYLGNPVCGIVQDGEAFNWDDLVAFYASDPGKPETPDDDSSWEVNIRKIHMDNGTVTYHNAGLSYDYTINQFNLMSPGFSTEHGLIPFNGNFHFEDIGGDLIARGSYDYQTMEYDAGIAFNSLGLKLFEPYLGEYLKIDTLGGIMTLITKIKGDFEGDIDYRGSGYILMENFRMIDEQQDSVCAFKVMIMALDTFNSVSREVKISQLVMDQPYVHFARYKQGDNFSALLQHPTAETDSILASTEGGIIPGQEYFNVFIYLGEYARYLAREYVNSDYAAEKIELQNGTINFEDYTLHENAKFLFQDLKVSTSKFNNEQGYATFELSTLINQTARFDATWKVNPKDILDMDLDYELHGLSISSLSPYCYFYTGYPLSHGDVLLEGNVHIHDRKLDSDNYLFLEDVNVDKRQFDNPPYKIPVRLAVALLKNLDGDIRLKVPVSGSLDDPDFHYWRVIWKVLQNLLVKAAVGPVKLLASLFQVNEESLREVPFDYGDAALTKESLKRLKHIGKVMKGKDEMALQYYLQGNADREMDKIALNYCMEEYLEEKAVDPGTKEGSKAPEELLIQDSVFTTYIMEHSPLRTVLASPQEHCRAIFGEDSLQVLYPRIVHARREVFQSYLTDSLGISPDRIHPWQPEKETVMDTLYLVRPTFLLNFDVADPDSINVKPIEQEGRM